MSQEIARKVNCICEHNWHKCVSHKSINASELLNIVQSKMYNQPLKEYVDEWLAKFAERSGFYPLFSRDTGNKAGGRMTTEESGHITILN